jgi:tRNA-(ms[2]io[6]A)-hydroxylase
MSNIQPVLTFLTCRTPAAWLDQAVRCRQALLFDHATLEFKAAQQAQRLIWKYGATSSDPRSGIGDRFRATLLHKMSRLAREELRHFEQVVALLEERGESYICVPASRYATGLHALIRKQEPDSIVDTLLVGAVIEARSCERFYSLQPLLEPVDPPLAKFYGSLLRSEARHFEDYLGLARDLASDDLTQRLGEFLSRDAQLILSPDSQLRFHSGVPVSAERCNSRHST